MSVCGICAEPLLIPSGAGEDPAHVPDDVQVRCAGAHHFHWECLIEHAARARGQCPACGQSVLDGAGAFLVDVRNEGGLTPGFDMGRELVRARSRTCG
jgi:hypothetical protein